MQKILLLLYVITTSLGLVVLKLGTHTGLPISFSGGKLSTNLNLYSVTGVVLYGISFMLYILLISKNDLGYIIPVTASFVYILVFIASYVIFKETFTAMKIVGIFLILSGLFFLNLSK